MFGGLRARKLKEEEAERKLAQKEAKKRREQERKTQQLLAEKQSGKESVDGIGGGGDGEVVVPASVSPPKPVAVEKGMGRLNVAD